MLQSGVTSYVPGFIAANISRMLTEVQLFLVTYVYKCNGGTGCQRQVCTVAGLLGERGCAVMGPVGCNGKWNFPLCQPALKALLSPVIAWWTADRSCTSTLS